MKNSKVREKIAELKVLLSALTAYGNLNLEAYSIIHNHLDGLFISMYKDNRDKKERISNE